MGQQDTGHCFLLLSRVETGFYMGTGALIQEILVKRKQKVEVEPASALHIHTGHQ